MYRNSASENALTHDPDNVAQGASFSRVCAIAREKSAVSVCVFILTLLSNPVLAIEPPVLAAIGDQAVDELNLLTFTATATDADIPANILTFSLDAGAPAGAGITTDGVFTWTPTEAQGPGSYPITVRVTDDEVPAMTDFETIMVTVAEVNVAPVLSAIGGSQAIDELASLMFTATATDSDVPANVLTFSLDAGAPTGASITTGGDFSWTPTEAQGPGNYPITVRVTDNGTPAMSDFQTTMVTVGEVNVEPVLAAIGDQPVDELNLLTFTATATDADMPANILTFSLDAGAPAGASITTGGVFTWTPTEAQGPGSFPITVRVTDDGAPTMSDFETITVTVGSGNQAPILAAIGDQAVDELDLLTFTATATDADIPADTLTFTLDAGVPAGANITTGGVFTWTPTEAQGPGSYPITVRVTDNGTPAMADFETITVTVAEVNVAPVLSAIGDQAVDELNLLTFAATATDSDVPANVLTFSLDVGAPTGASITTGGVFTWTPTEAQGPGSFPITVRVTDNGTPAMSDFETITVTVGSGNQAPVLAAIGDQAIDELNLFTFMATATDADIPADILTFSLDAGTPAGVSITTGGLFAWTPTEAQGPGSYPITVRVTDNGTPAMADFETITVTVAEVNSAPTATAQSVSTAEDTALPITLTGSDPEMDPLTFAIATQPINGILSGAAPNVTYTPDMDYNGPDSFTFTVDDGEFTSTAATVSITVNEGNDAPTANAQSVSTPEDTALPITLTGSDPESDPLTFAIATGPSNGVLSGTAPNITYTPNANYNGPDSFTFTVDDGEFTSPAATVSITVDPVNDPPTATAQSVSTAEDTLLPITLTGSDLEMDSLTFAIASQPGNGTLSGIPPNVTYTPNLDYNGPDSFTFTVDDGEFTSIAAIVSITVTAENDDPTVLVPIEDQLAIEGTPFSLDVSVNFADADGDTLQYTASGLPTSGNLSFDTNTGVFSGTPTVDDARDNDPYIITVTATDGDALSVPAVDTFELTISALDRANVSLDVSVIPDPALLNDELSWTFTAANALGPQAATNVVLTGSFVGAGLGISSTSGSCTIGATVGQKTDFQCVVGDLPVGGSTTVVLTTATSLPGDVFVFATAATTDTVPLDPNEDDNSSQMAVGVAEAFSNGLVQVLGSANVLSVAAGDINGDGAADIVVGTAAGQPLQIYLSDGFRAFAPSPAPTDTSAHEGLALADFDGNGSLDLVVANGGGLADVVYGNDGGGIFAAMATLGSTFSQDVAVGDFDNDGNMDVVFATVQGNPVYLGDGSGGFALQASLLGNANSHAVAVGQFNGDQRDDVVFANVGSDSQVWIKNAGAGFSQGGNLQIGDVASVTVGDFDGDTFLDLAFGRILSVAGDVPANPVLANDGSGGFTNTIALLGAAPTGDIHAGDVNRDGLSDLVFINSNGVHQIWISTGGGFDLHNEQIADADSTVGVLTELGMTDIGDPGGVDLALGGAVASGLGVYLNDGFGNLGRGDAVPPVLALVGDALVLVPSGTAYAESGATAEDNIDGDISASVVVSGSVNTAIVGDYVITYNATDSAGNGAAPITRTVTVTPAAGSGGGGGGSASQILLVLLMVAACLTAGKRAIIPANIQTRNQRGRRNV